VSSQKVKEIYSDILVAITTKKLMKVTIQTFLKEKYQTFLVQHGKFYSKKEIKDRYKQSKDL